MSKYNPLVRPFSYSDMDNMLRALSGRILFTRKVQNNTWLERRPDGIAVKLHNTDIVTWHQDNTITLHSGGWHTTTTRNRMNNWLPFKACWNGETTVRMGLKVDSDHGMWVLNTNLEPEVYHDGVVLDAVTGTVWRRSPDVPSLNDVKKHNAKLETYINGWLKTHKDHTGTSLTFVLTPDMQGLYLKRSAETMGMNLLHVMEPEPFGLELLRERELAFLLDMPHLLTMWIRLHRQRPGVLTCTVTNILHTSHFKALFRHHVRNTYRHRGAVYQTPVDLRKFDPRSL